MVKFLYVGLFVLGALGLAIAPMVLAIFIAPRRTRGKPERTKQAIECGMEPIGDAWVRFDAVYYAYALIFVAFAVDVLYLFPVAVVYNKEFPVRDFVELTLFVGILSMVVIYAWKKGVFTWSRRTYPRQ